MLLAKYHLSYYANLVVNPDARRVAGITSKNTAKYLNTSGFKFYSTPMNVGKVENINNLTHFKIV